MNSLSNSDDQQLNGLDVCSGPSPSEASAASQITEVDDFHGRSSAAKQARFGGLRKAQTSGDWDPDDVR